MPVSIMDICITCESILRHSSSEIIKKNYHTISDILLLANTCQLCNLIISSPGFSDAAHRDPKHTLQKILFDLPGTSEVLTWTILGDG